MSALSLVHLYCLCLQIDTPEGGGRTPLMYAAARSPLEMVTLLLEAGAAVTVWDQRGRTAYHHAIRARNGPALRALLRYWPRPLFAEWRHHRRAHRARLKQQATSAAAVAAAGGSGGHTRDVSAAVSVVRPMALSSADRIHDAQQLLGITATPSGTVAAAAGGGGINSSIGIGSDSEAAPSFSELLHLLFDMVRLDDPFRVRKVLRDQYVYRVHACLLACLPCLC